MRAARGDSSLLPAKSAGLRCNISTRLLFLELVIASAQSNPDISWAGSACTAMSIKVATAELSPREVNPYFWPELSIMLRKIKIQRIK
jgi:hypothetical protein